jgi:hypothetical protein
MRRLVALSSLAALAVPAVLAMSTGIAAASGTAPAPFCGSSSSTFFCDASSPVSTVTWTMTISSLGTKTTSNFNASRFLHGNCEVRAGYTFSFSYVSGGVTYNSGSTTFICTASPPE